MKLGQDFFQEAKSSFLSVDKDYSIIVNKILTNDNLCKLLFYSQKDCLKANDLTMEQKIGMLNKQIKIIPVTKIDSSCPIQINIVMDGFLANKTNPEFRDCVIVFHVLCHPDHWHLGNFALRPFKIIGELDAMFNEARLTGIGTLQYLGCNNLVMNGDLIGMSLGYGAIHGEEDKINPLC